MDYKHPNRPASTDIAVIVIALLLCICVFLNRTYGGPDISGSFDGATPAAGAQSQTTAETLEKSYVQRVVDGDTIVVTRSDGSSAKVRLIGIDAPESVAEDTERNSEEGRQASAFLASLVTQGSEVWLQKDMSDTDSYGRLLRYVWIAEPDDLSSITSVRDEMLEGIIVTEGYARSKRYEPDVFYNDYLDSLMADAIREGRGVSYLWN